MPRFIELFVSPVKQHKNIIFLFVTLLMVLTVPLIVFQTSRIQETRSRASTSPIALLLSPLTAAQAVGSSFTVSLSMDTGSNNITGVDTKIAYDPTKLTLVSFTPAATFTTITNDTGVAGTIHYVGVNLASSTITGTSVPLASLSFQATAAGNAIVGFSDIQATALGINTFLNIDTTRTQNGTYTITEGSNAGIPPAGTGTPTPTPNSVCLTPPECPQPPPNCSYERPVELVGGSCPTSCGTLVCTSPVLTLTPTPLLSPTPVLTATPTPTPLPGTPTLALHIKLPGIGVDTAKGENNNPVRNARTVTINFIQGTTVKSITGTVIYADGAFSGIIPLTGVNLGTYIVKVKLDNTLTKLLPGAYTVATAASLQSDVVTLGSGDIVQDNIIDISDYNILLSCLQSGGAFCSTVQNASSDLNDDKAIDAKDLNILLRAFAARFGD